MLITQLCIQHLRTYVLRCFPEMLVHGCARLHIYRVVHTYAETCVGTCRYAYFSVCLFIWPCLLRKQGIPARKLTKSQAPVICLFKQNFGISLTCFSFTILSILDFLGDIKPRHAFLASCAGIFHHNFG